MYRNIKKCCRNGTTFFGIHPLIISFSGPNWLACLHPYIRVTAVIPNHCKQASVFRASKLIRINDTGLGYDESTLNRVRTAQNYYEIRNDRFFFLGGEGTN